jgi:hypothetical protein
MDSCRASESPSHIDHRGDDECHIGGEHCIAHRTGLAQRRAHSVMAFKREPASLRARSPEEPAGEVDDRGADERAGEARDGKARRMIAGEIAPE